jgi:hypothetical protein
MAKKSVDLAEVDVTTAAGPVTALKNIILRIIAVFAASGLSVIGAGSLVGIDTMKAVILAGTLGVATVVEKLARGFINDGQLTLDEINEAFNSVDKKAPTA